MAHCKKHKFSYMDHLKRCPICAGEGMDVQPQPKWLLETPKKKPMTPKKKKPTKQKPMKPKKKSKVNLKLKKKKPIPKKLQGWFNE